MQGGLAQASCSSSDQESTDCCLPSSLTLNNRTVTTLVPGTEASEQLKGAEEQIDGRRPSISLTAGCEIFVRYVTRLNDEGGVSHQCNGSHSLKC